MSSAGLNFQAILAARSKLPSWKDRINWKGPERRRRFVVASDAAARAKLIDALDRAGRIVQDAIRWGITLPPKLPRVVEAVQAAPA